MASVRNMVEKKLEALEESVQELRDELDNGDFDNLTRSSDRISEQADELSAKFEAITKAMGDDDQEGDEGEDGEGQKQQKATKQPKPSG